MMIIHADEVQPGDVIEDHGTVHRITHVDRHDGWAWPVAFDGSGWAMALGHSLLHVDRQAA
jgi:hypothetical protein